MSGRGFQGRKPRVVIVDDSRTIQALLNERFTTRLDWDVVGIAGSADEGIRLVRQIQPDVVTVDLVMPGGDGFSMLEALSDLPGLCKIIIASNFDSNINLAIRAQSLGVTMHVDKKGIMQQPGELCDKLRGAVIAHLQRRSPEPNTHRSARVHRVEQPTDQYPIPFDEQERLHAVSLLGLENTSRDVQFDQITHHLAKVIEFPVVMMTIVGRETQWIKSAVGFSVRSTSREEAFCNHTICGDGLLAVPNAAVDERFKNNPLVTRGPKIRSYFGYPIEGPAGVKLGALCAIDVKPRQLSATLTVNLEGLARIASSVINARMISSCLSRI